MKDEILIANHTIMLSYLKKYKQAMIVIAIGLLTTIILTIQLVYLTKYPPVFIDESWNANTAWTWLTTGKNFDAIHTGTLDQFGYEWIRRPFLGTVPWLISFGLLGLGLFQARLVSWFFGIFLILAIFYVGRRSYSLITGALAALLLSLSVPFVQGSHWARQDIMLACTIMIAYGLTLFALDKDKWWGHLLAGLLAGFALDIHQNASIFLLGFASVYLLTYRSQVFRKAGTWLFAIGSLIGLIYFVALHILPSPSAYSSIFSFNYLTSQQPLLFKFNIRNLLSSVDDAIGMFHFFENSLEFALIGASIAYLAVRRSRSDLLLLTFLSSMIVSFVLLVGDKVDHYAILIYPFLVLAISETFVSLLRSSQSIRGQRIFISGVLILFIFSSSIHYIRPLLENRDYRYYDYTELIKQATPENVLVMGSPLWWLGLSEYPYSSSLNLTYYHFYNDFNLTEGLEKIKPDVIIVDDILRQQLRTEEGQIKSRFYLYPEAEQEFRDILSKYGDTVLQFSTPWYGTVEVYRMNWNRG